MSNQLMRLSGFLVSIAIGAIPAFDLITRPDKSPVTIVGDIISLDAVLFGVAVVATGTAIAFAWPAIVWLCAIPKRRAEQKRAEAELQRVEAEERERRHRTAILDILTKVQGHRHLVDSGILGFEEFTEAEETVAVAKEQLHAMDLGLPKGVEDTDDGWSYYASRLIPHVTAGGIERAKRKVAEWLSDESVAKGD